MEMIKISEQPYGYDFHFSKNCHTYYVVNSIIDDDIFFKFELGLN